ncbi:hypothetical protein FHX74_002844 [Friedmanniella endophytica]|uniref:Uncharacterized protein n=1 Tax=Microlunatus kandeliicorticis TaxID=1759536 RepID=A0A7W3IU01_9ACTN|nr:hypothetical protein [Microlunatus kandeliicorticis]MBA8795216.1 hypothetical protein [Microlunatus kandeliicorticis]
MKPIPAELPHPRSRRWANRRWWDPLGYLRVRSLSNPGWHREPDRVLRELLAQRKLVPAEEQRLLDRAIAATRRYPRTAAGHRDPDAAWDEVLTAVDAFLVARQRRHLHSAAGARENSRRPERNPSG